MSPNSAKHNVFLSFYHKDDKHYRDKFEELFEDICNVKCVHEGDIADENSHDYIKTLIQEHYISGSSVVVVLIGPKTYCRKHVDWEISAGLNKKVGGYSGLFGLALPTHSDYLRDKYDASITPARLVDNLKSKYAEYHDWTENENFIKDWIEVAFNAREDKVDQISNSREQFDYNRCG
jgi:hypothetical protein